MAANVVDANVVQNAFQALLTSLTPDQMTRLTQQLNVSAHPQGSPVGPEQTSKLKADEMVKHNQIDARSIRLQKAIRAKARQVEAQAKARKRPTNSFMAFRAYYSPELRGLTQKVKSGLIRQMWQAEPRKHFFALLAKAHSELRDNHRDQINFEKFLAAATGVLPIIPAHLYFETMGWEISTGPEGEVTLSRAAALPVDTEKYPMSSNISARDILEHCYKIGLATRPPRPMRQVQGQVPSMESGMTMSFAAAPKFSIAPLSVKKATASSIQRMLDPEIRDRLEAPAISAPPEFDFNNLRTDYRPSMQMVAADQQQAYERLPFNYHFHPEMPTIVGWDPSMIQDEFDPFSFDIGDFVNFEF